MTTLLSEHCSEVQTQNLILPGAEFVPVRFTSMKQTAWFSAHCFNQVEAIETKLKANPEAHRVESWFCRNVDSYMASYSDEDQEVERLMFSLPELDQKVMELMAEDQPAKNKVDRSDQLDNYFDELAKFDEFSKIFSVEPSISTLLQWGAEGSLACLFLAYYRKFYKHESTPLFEFYK
ncbi:hypothetical protein [Vibrio fluvialis]|uniref:hypothetical protein n=1 Tax=Vibrio fluvialis TaxID=676 RepID=UPI0013027754|nr:hypothetical protein [Vibrio fluvialis]